MPIVHDRVDMELLRSVTIANNAVTESIDCLQTGCIDEANLVIEVPAQPGLVAGKSVTVTLQGCDTPDGTFAAVEGVAPLKVDGVAGGVSAHSLRLRFPVGCPQYVRASVAVTADAVVTGSVTLSVQV